MIAGLRVYTSDVLGDPYEDWSRVRSHGRARRRLKAGHRQNIVTRYRANGTVMHDRMNNALYCHPHDWHKIMRIVSEGQAKP